MSLETEQREPDQLAGVDPPEYPHAVIGHQQPRERLSALLDGGRLPGGILMHGPRGIGKATLAFQLAREIFERTGDEAATPVAEQVAAGGYPNLRVLRKAAKETGKGFYTAIRVEEVRELVDRLHKTRGRAGHRIVVVDAIDDCNVSSANALLKILEEPPPETLFLLISHRPGQLLPTIRSRCQQLAMRPLGDDEVRQVLAKAHPDAAPADIDAAVSLAAGRPRRGLEALLLGNAEGLTRLRQWLGDPATPPAATHLAIADILAADRDGAQARFARDLVLGWLAEEARQAAGAGPAGRSRLASASELWEKALAMFEDADIYNLDARQTLVTLFDAIRKHVFKQIQLSEQR
ncbi:MAG TPA: AAA family ATPase [Devosiaceae bacterium]|nr:AAA family ATPase [Devosiaceae bacterium]